MTEARPVATIVKIWSETPRLMGVLLQVEDAVAQKYERPGQVVVLHPAPDQKVYIAIASAPGQPGTIELLLGPDAVKKLAPEVGKTIALDPPMGKGFPLEMAKGRDVLLFAVGSALAPVRPLIAHIRAHRADYKQVVLYVGAHTAEDFPYSKEFEAWEADGIEIVRSHSRPWVQDVFQSNPRPLENAAAFVCGMKDMMEGVSAVLVGAGLPADRIGKNW